MTKHMNQKGAGNDRDFRVATMLEEWERLCPFEELSDEEFQQGTLTRDIKNIVLYQASHFHLSFMLLLCFQGHRTHCFTLPTLSLHDSYY